MLCKFSNSSFFDLFYQFLYTVSNVKLLCSIMKKSLGIIGFGQFSQFIIPYLKPYFSDIVVSSRKDKKEIANKLKVKFARVEEAAGKDVIILAMTISEIENALKKIKSEIKPKAIVLDVCSVKIYPLKMMRKYLPENISILGTHPLFGPQSGKNGIENLEIVLCPERISESDLKKIRNIFLKVKLKVIISSAEEHDLIMAYSQALTHFFAQGALKTIPKSDFKFSTPSARKLLAIINDIKNDSPKLFQDIETLNPYAKQMRTRLLENLNKINNKLQI